MSTKRIHIWFIQLLLLFTIVFSSCIDDEKTIPSPGGQEKIISFSVHIPGAKTFQPYKLTEQQENEVKSIEILLFDTQGKFVYNPIYSNNISSHPNDSRIKTFSVKIPEGTYNMVVLGNARKSLGAIIKDIEAGTPKETIMSKLVFTNNEKWNTNAASEEYTPIPLWGEINRASIGPEGSNSLSLQLVRMIAKIDIVLTTETAQNKLKMESVRLYNYNNQGCIAPEDSNWDAHLKHVTAPSIPPSAQKPDNPASAALIYAGETIVDDISCTNEIYTFEAEAGSSATLQTNTCLVIGGIYGNEQQPSYYRIDFANTTSGKTTFLPLLRNHNYKVNITDISAPGFSTPEEAFRSRPVNIEAEVIEWDEADISNIVFNGQYMLGVSQGEFIFSRDAYAIVDQNNTLQITTDYPGGWIVEKIVTEENTPADWLNLTPDKGSAGVTSESKLILSANSSEKVRKAIIHIKAGRLNYMVQVTQDIKGKTDIKIVDEQEENEITELVFSSSTEEAPPKTFILQWYPPSENVQIRSSESPESTFFDPNYDRPGLTETSITNGTGRKTFTIRPQPFSIDEIKQNPFKTKDTHIIFSVSNGEETFSKTLRLQHMMNAVTVKDLTPIYKLDGSTHKITIASNAKWKIKSIKEIIHKGDVKTLLNLKPSDNMVIGTKGGQAFTYMETTLSFTVKNTVNKEGVIILELESDDPKQTMDDVVITLRLMNQYTPGQHTKWAGTNIYYDTKLKHLTFDTLTTSTKNKRAQGVYFKWGSLWGISPAGSYSDYKLVFPPQGGVKVVAETPYKTYKDIPYVDQSVVLNADISHAYLYEITDEKTGVGDICKYLTDKGWAPKGKWRMPTRNEINVSFSSSANTSWTNIKVKNPFGEETIENVFMLLDNIILGRPTIPANGFFHPLSESPHMTGISAFLWTSTPKDNQSYKLQGVRTSIKKDETSTQPMDRASGLGIRCVREEEP